LLEALTEVVVLISLFSAGVKMPAPVTFARWRAPVLLASVSMVVSVGLVAAYACLQLDLPVGAGILLGAILSPTDPVLFVDSWSLRAVALALFLFMVVRPASVLLGLVGTRTTWRIRNMVGWFGVRGIGSLYYLMFAIQHGLPEPLALELIELTLIAVTLSIFVHGISVKPVMERFWKTRQPSPKP
jgi:NhaP-type Na+/H+ or K+/H+ antiporter